MLAGFSAGISETVAEEKGPNLDPACNATRSSSISKVLPCRVMLVTCFEGRIRVVGEAPLRRLTESKNIELTVGVEYSLKLFGKFGPFLGARSFRQLPQIQILSGVDIVVFVA